MITIFENNYDVDSLSDIGRDISECFDPKFNKAVSNIPNNFDGTVTVKITYTANDNILDKKEYWREHYYEETNITWEDFDNDWFWCIRCRSYQKGYCICYAR